MSTTTVDLPRIEELIRGDIKPWFASSKVSFFIDGNPIQGKLTCKVSGVEPQERFLGALRDVSELNLKDIKALASNLNAPLSCIPFSFPTQVFVEVFKITRIWHLAIISPDTRKTTFTEKLIEETRGYLGCLPGFREDFAYELRNRFLEWARAKHSKASCGTLLEVLARFSKNPELEKSARKFILKTVAEMTSVH